MWNIFGKKNGKLIEVKILGMHCTSCAVNIDLALEELPGVIKADTNYAKGTAKIEIDDKKFEAESAVKAILELGYKARVI